MKTNVLLTTLITVLTMSCNNTSKTSKKTETNEEAIQQIEDSKMESYTLQKRADFRDEDNPDYIVYESKVDDYRFRFHTKTTIAYGALEKYSEELDRSDYYLFPKQENLQDQLTLNLKDTLFLKKSTEFNPTYPEDSPEYTFIELLLKNYMILGFGGDPSYPHYSIINININKQTVSNFETRGDFEVSAGEKFLMGWHDSKTNTNAKAICPEHKDMINNYVVTEEFKHNLDTGEETLTGKLGCELVQ